MYGLSAVVWRRTWWHVSRVTLITTSKVISDGRGQNILVDEQPLGAHVQERPLIKLVDFGSGR
jgi:hypothetical protein